MSDVIRVEDDYYVLATSALADDRTRVLKDGDAFAVFDRYGDVQALGRVAQGIFHGGTRFLSRWVLQLGQQRPLLLSSGVLDDNALLAVDLTNPDLFVDGSLHIPHGTLHLARTKFLHDETCYERLRVTNFGPRTVEVELALELEADFCDVFEIRGTRRTRRGSCDPPRRDGDALVLSYRGLDDLVRTTRVHVAPAPLELGGSRIHFSRRLEPHQHYDFYVTVSCHSGGNKRAPGTYAAARRQAAHAHKSSDAQACRLWTSNQQFNAWLYRSMVDLRMMTTRTECGDYPFAGVPWYSAPFGRDGIITALETLRINPDIARGVLRFLASTQAHSINRHQDAEPGKILHERRSGEMAALGEIPFGSYYGSVDATPLFVVLVYAYYQRTADHAFAREMWPHVERALTWMGEFGDRDHDGFVEYARHSAQGLVNQGWKDSHDAIFHADGALAVGPIALCEVQAYVYAAKLGASQLALALGEPARADALLHQAESLARSFEEQFWCDDIATYALALDGDKQPCRVRSSNAGLCLFGGIVGNERAGTVADSLLGADFSSGWGIRTVAAGEARYNPMSYHNGSVWPHDNALIAWGMARYGFNDKSVRVLGDLFDASIALDQYRLPELMCGFSRRPNEGPTLYPVACLPQSWAAASVFMLLQACLGLSIDATNSQVRFTTPVLPPCLETIEISGLRVADDSLDLVLRRHAADVGIEVVSRQGSIEVVTVK